MFCSQTKYEYEQGARFDKLSACIQQRRSHYLCKGLLEIYSIIIMDIAEGTTIQKVDTLLNADSVEFCPHEGLHHILLCGTYQLKEATPELLELVEPEPDKVSEDTQCNDDATIEDSNTAASQIRLGGVSVYGLVFDNSSISDLHLKEWSKVKMCGVLDIKWSPAYVDNKALFGIVDAEGYVQIFRLTNEDYTPETISKTSLSDCSLGLSLDWTGDNDSLSPLLAASDSTGSITVLDVNNDLSMLSTWKAHEYEAWITAFNKHDSNVVFTGGDDSLLKTWDLRDLSRPTIYSKRHKMGVCSIQSHPFNEHLLATGSYDEELIIWDNRNFKQALNSVFLGGGIWRIKWDPLNGTSILTATMYNGAHIIDCSELGKNTLPVVVSYKDHNLAYGADWCRLNKTGKCRHNDDKDVLISTCSFYDHSLHLWQWKNLIKTNN